MRNFNYFLILIVAAVVCATYGCGQGRGSDKTNKESAVTVDEIPKAVAISTEEAQEQLMQSSLDGDLNAVVEALEAGAEPNSPDPEGRTALMFAAFNGHSEIVLELLENDAGIDRRDLMGRTALLYAATGPFPETVKILLDKGAEANVVDSDEHFSPLMHAAAEGHMDVVKILLEAGADHKLTDVDGDNAETFARQAGHQAVADLLKSAK